MHDTSFQRPFDTELPGGITVCGQFVAELGRVVSITFDDGTTAEIGGWGHRVDWVSAESEAERPWLMALSKAVLAAINDGHRFEIESTGRAERPMSAPAYL